MATEWEDILMDHGIIPDTRSKGQSSEENGLIYDTLQSVRFERELYIEESESERNGDNCSEEDFSLSENDEIYTKYREARIKEIMHSQEDALHSSTTLICRNRYKELTATLDHCIVYLFAEADKQACLNYSAEYKAASFSGKNGQNCRLQLITKVEADLKELAKQSAVKLQLYRMISTDCIPNYPDKHLPTLLVYKKGELVGTLAAEQCANLLQVVPSLVRASSN